MFECQICGLLSLGGTACPACGSQLRTDLSLDGTSDEVLPTEVPGLDDAAAAWYDLEGIEPPAEEVEEETMPAPATSSLPFGFQGESTVYDSRLPFGIGSFADGIPFDPSQGAESLTRAPETGWSPNRSPLRTSNRAKVIRGINPYPSHGRGEVSTVLNLKAPLTHTSRRLHLRFLNSRR